MQIYLFNIDLFYATSCIYILLLSANVDRISESNPIMKKLSRFQVQVQK